MKTKQVLFLFLMTLCAVPASGQDDMQVSVNGKDLNEYDFIEVYLYVAPFSTKENIFIDTGDNDFKVSNQSATKNQCVFYNGEKLKKGDYFKLKKYFLDKGWTQEGTRESSLGDSPLTIITFIK